MKEATALMKSDGSRDVPKGNRNISNSGTECVQSADKKRDVVEELSNNDHTIGDGKETSTTKEKRMN